ncbi:uncharacterized protein LOC120766988 [Bactrocera tryoni]|uniref:uncharacterized protein LOC120766988 n=1 Tax=Bactrocera tryoni TaxID=59916 RepID=UPI001A976116|nr:uncharacterized protein LOC120766988 [Bactrocera tryoni]
MAAQSYAAFAGPTCVRRYWLICCQIILFACLLCLLIVLLCPSYILTNGNDNAYNNNNSSNTSTQRDGDFPTQIRNKLEENPNSQQEAPHHHNRSVEGNVVVVVDGVVGGLLDDHNNLPKSRNAAGRDYGRKTAWPAYNDAPAGSTFVMEDGEEIITSSARILHNSKVNNGNAVGNKTSTQNPIKLAPLGNILKSRQKKFLIFSGAGVLKHVVGVSFPIPLADPHRSFNHYYNLQIQYPNLPRPLYWWNFFNSSSFAARRRQRQLTEATHKKLNPHIKHDASREFIYKGIEQIFEQQGLPGEFCLQQAICEVSQLPFHVPRIWRNDLRHFWQAIINAILIPTVPNVDMKYLHASQAGRFGVDCQQAFSQCPQRVNEWLRRVANMV